jgi:PilZ domain
MRNREIRGQAATVSKASWRTALVLGATGMMAVTKKRDARKSVRQPAWITLEGGFAARQCMVQDISTTGAKITVDDPDILPAKLRLAFSRDARTGRNCAVVWRRGKSVGVKFVQ